MRSTVDGVTLGSDEIEERGYASMFKKLLIIAFLLLATPAWAQNRGHGNSNRNGNDNGNRWGNQGHSVPELNPGGLAAVATLLGGGLLILGDEARKRAAGLAR